MKAPDLHLRAITNSGTDGKAGNPGAEGRFGTACASAASRSQAPDMSSGSSRIDE